jgi:uncharacterized repeat protein (TIGR03803 family)
VKLNRFYLLLAVATLVFAFATRAQASSTYKVIYTFHFTDGEEPIGDMVLDSSGNLYGTTVNGGANHSGTIFKLTQGAGGTWSETVLHSFTNGTDGGTPQSSVIIDAAGNLYGTASTGGDPTCRRTFCGVVFQLTPNSDGTWTENILHSFRGSDGLDPTASLAFDGAGNIYGTTYSGGNFGLGTVYELSPVTGGAWTETVLHSFGGQSTDGASPNSQPVFDLAGNLYGTTTNGGAAGCGTLGCGTIFKLSPKSGGGWSYRMLHAFDSTHGALPTDLTPDSAGHLFLTTLLGGPGACTSPIANGCGVAFDFTPTSGGNLSGRIIHNYNAGTQNPHRLTLDSSGTLYGPTTFGGHLGCNQNLTTCGTVYKLTPSGTSYTFSALHAFLGGTDGQWPIGGLTIDSTGNIYGATQSGGDLSCGVTDGCGVVFEITP